MAVLVEPEILIARRAFPKAQQLLAGVPDRGLHDRVEVGWHGTLTDPETGAFAVVRAGGPYVDLAGEIIAVTFGSRTVFVYVLGVRGVPTDISLTRRAFLALGRLSRETLPALVEVVF